MVTTEWLRLEKTFKIKSSCWPSTAKSLSPFLPKTCSLQDALADWGKAWEHLVSLSSVRDLLGPHPDPWMAFIPHKMFSYSPISYSGNWKMPNVTSLEESGEKLKHYKLEQPSLLVWVFFLFFSPTFVCAWLMWVVIAALPTSYTNDCRFSGRELFHKTLFLAQNLGC